LTDPTGLDFYLQCNNSDHSGCSQALLLPRPLAVRGVGVKPGFEVRVTLEDLKLGRDSVLEKALELAEGFNERPDHVAAVKSHQLR